MNTMNYKGYVARVEFDSQDGCFFGRLAGIDDIITFHGESVAELRKAFEEAVDFYLESSAKHGLKPQKPHSGKIMLRVPPELHARAAMLAAAHGKSLNQWVAEAMAKAE
jgi:predicted HicB family RNase H-like nuclease